ncbi:hypothetical protein C9374_004154 [Naegleria lovaniensis]|uniref:Uncharacterized protein n=1 Tax=Naegleria lovaniensis TaxID=51637 RepID=A0AA88GS64_NAELO|nr:uncharacterized protein C9374_004154 [Naegleria lovaniensis]KAG2383483.1 hypothetical protein C9374_004154 [Naegleria lovaniensis]
MNRSSLVLSKLFKSSPRSSFLMRAALSTPTRVRAFHQTSMRRDEEELQKTPEVKVKPAWQGWVKDVLNFFYYPMRWTLLFAVLAVLLKSSQLAKQKESQQ